MSQYKVVTTRVHRGVRPSRVSTTIMDAGQCEAHHKILMREVFDGEILMFVVSVAEFIKNKKKKVVQSDG